MRMKPNEYMVCATSKKYIEGNENVSKQKEAGIRNEEINRNAHMRINSSAYTYLGAN
jgi:hypothetical protein